MTTNEELKLIIQGMETKIENQHAHHTEQHTTLIELITQGGGNIPQPEPEPQGPQPLYSKGDKPNRQVQMAIKTRLSVPKIKNGEIMYTFGKDGRKKGMQHVKPTTTPRVYPGEVWEVFAPHVQGDGTRLYEVVTYPGLFIRGNTCVLVPR